MNKQLTTQLLNSIPQPKDKIQAAYIWIDGSGEVLRTKTRTLESGAQIPDWNFDGSSTGQAEGFDSEILLKPKAVFKDPFRGGSNILVLCDTYDPVTEKPIPSNTRAACDVVMEQAKDSKPWFGIEQEYTLFDLDGIPIGWPKDGSAPKPQGPYYCAVGADRVFARDIVEVHYRACLYAGINISGTNAEVLPGQYEYQVGPCEGISGADQLWVSRFLLHRVCELYQVVCSFDPKPVEGDWNGSGCHTNFSTEKMRTPGIGYSEIQAAVKKLEAKHKEHIQVYGRNNEKRLSGMHETSKIDSFSVGIGSRGCSVRIPNMTVKQGFGYFEDRRPASNMDPYLVTRMLVETSVLTEEGGIARN